MKLQVQSTRPGGPCFDVLSYDPETKMGVLVGSLGTTFPHSMDKDYLLRNNYKVIKVDDAVPVVAAVPQTGPAPAFGVWPLNDDEE